MDTAAQWPQGIGVVKSMEGSRPLTERRPRPQNEQALNCPRCHSTNTKFCYYNNYSLSQPRYFCKTCRRYWTEGGSLRNVPVGGGSRKNKRSSSTSSPSSLKQFPRDHDHHLTTSNNFSQSSASQNPKIHQGQDLNLAYHPPITSTDHYNNPNPSSSSNSPHLSATELLKSTGIVSRGLSSFIPMPVAADQHHTNAIYSSSSGFSMEEFKPSTLNFSLDGIESTSSGYNGSLHHQGVVQDSSTSARLFFPFEGLKLQAPPNTDQFHHHEQNRGQGESTGYWSGMLGGGGSW